MRTLEDPDSLSSEHSSAEGQGTSSKVQGLLRWRGEMVQCSAAIERQNALTPKKKKKRFLQNLFLWNQEKKKNVTIVELMQSACSDLGIMTR